MNTPWSIQLFGSLRLRQGEQVISRFRTQKTGALLACLAYYRGRSQTREGLIEMLWPETELESGRHSLSLALSSLRNQLEPPGVPAGAVLVADRFAVELNPDAFTTDVYDFEQALRRAAQSRTAPNYVPLLTEAVEKYSVSLLPHYYEAWIAPEQERLQQRFLQTTSQLLGLLEKEGALEQALEVARRALFADPYREEAHRDVMRLLAAVGQPEEALRQFRELERLFSQELGETPASVTWQLARQIEAQVPNTPKAPPSPLPVRLPTRSEDSLPALPDGTVTFLLTDIESSTALWEKTGEAFRAALTIHHALLRAEFRRNGGQEVKEAGDSFLVAFASVSDGLACAISCQRALAAQPWPEATGRLKVRMALHTGDVALENGEYHGLMLHRAARILSAGHGGQILASEATAGLLRRDLEPGVKLKDLGVWRLRDVEEPERLFQVETLKLESQAFPPLRATSAQTAHLPLQFTRFFGREKDLAQLQKMLHEQGTRLITLTGPGGTGKTRLAIEAAGQVAEDYSGAVWFVPLADLSDPALIAGEIVAALGIPRSSNEELFEQVVTALAKQPSLLILDNFEQVVAEGAEIVQTLRERVPTLTLLVTSRQLLSLPGEREFAVPPLPIPNGPDTPEQLGLYESVRLFVDRAQAVKPDFQVTNQNAPAVAELCDRLEGSPLSIELAAARAQVLTPVQMLQQLSNCFEFLVSRKRGVSERQRTLRGAIDWSYRLLTPELQQFFARLSVFRGGWTAAAAEEIGEESLALDYLAQLRECSLVLTEERAGTIRFRMLETIRQYSGECLAARGTQRQSRLQHRDFFLRLGGQGKEQFTEKETVSEHWLEVLDAEHDNLRQALQFSLEEPGEAATGLIMASCLQWYWTYRGYWQEGRERLTTLLSHPETQEPTHIRGDALVHASKLASAQNDLMAALALMEEALEIARKLGDKKRIASALHGLGILRRMDWATATFLVQESLALRREAGDREGIAASIRTLGNFASDQGDYVTARKRYEESLEIRKELGDKRGIAEALGRLEDVSWREGDSTQARSFAEAILAIRQELGDRPGIANALGSLGKWEESLAIKRELGDKTGIAHDLMFLGCLANSQGNYAAARTYHGERIEIWRELEHSHHLAWAFLDMGHVAEEQSDYTAARKLYEEAAAIYKAKKDRTGITRFLESFARFHARQGRPEKAAQLWGAAEALHEQIQWAMLLMYRAEYAASVAAGREAMEQEAFRAAWEKGRAIPWEEAMTYAFTAETA